MLRTQTDPSLCALAQVASRSQTALLSGLGHALTQATGRQPDDLCHRKGTSHLPDHGRGRRRLTKPKSFRSGVLVQNVQTPGPLPFGRGEGETSSGVWRIEAHGEEVGCSSGATCKRLRPDGIPYFALSSSTSQFFDKYDALRGYRQLGRKRHDPGLAVGCVNARFAARCTFERRERQL